MPSGTGPYLVNRREDGYGEVHPLQTGHRFTLGRANTNRIVLKDDLASREHAEVYFAEQRWRLRDLKSLNGTLINGHKLDADWELAGGDEFQVGRTRFVFVETLNELPEVVVQPPPGGFTIRKSLGETRFLTPAPIEDAPDDQTPAPTLNRSLNRDLALLYRLALAMGSARNEEDLANVVLDGLFEAVSAEVGAVLVQREGRKFEVLAKRLREGITAPYSPVSEFVTNEVLSRRQAILADDVSRDKYLRDRESLSNLGATSLICAPVQVGAKTLGLIHLYCTDPHKSLTEEDLEFTMAVAKQLSSLLQQLQTQDSLLNQNQELRDQLRVESELIGQSPSMKAIEEQIGRVAGTNATILIRGESGSGKELVARAIHFSSPRRAGPFICLNCAAITETLLESELFGHEKGAFTGATEKKIGKFEAANRGTIFLDEIGEMSVQTQAKLLRILEGHPFERVGGSTPIVVDVRVVAATNQPLEKNIHEGKFRRDLFFRLQVIELRLPPLRERKSDIAMLADHFLKRFARETGRRPRGFAPAALAKLESYDWPGNVRELKNVIERAVALGRGVQIEGGDIWLSTLDLHVPPAAREPFEPISLEEMEKRHILKILDHADWNKSQAAGILGIERSTLDRKIKGYGLNREGVH